MSDDGEKMEGDGAHERAPGKVWARILFIGCFLAALIASAIALIIADQTFGKLNYLTFIGNNPSVSGPKRRRWWSLRT